MTFKPTWLLAGGPGSSRKHLVELLARALSDSGLDSPAVAYLGSASEDDPGFFRRMGDLLQAAGAGSVTLAPTVGKRVRIGATQTLLKNADVIFVSGGDVEAGMAVLENHDLITFLHGLHAAGKTFIGLSAGSIMLAKGWVRWRDHQDDSTAELFPCLGIAPVYCDTHAESDDWEELHALMKLLPAGQTGYGIPSPSALRTIPGKPVDCVGPGIVTFTRSPG